MSLQLIVGCVGALVLVACIVAGALCVAAARGDRMARERLVDMRNRYGQKRLP